MAEAVRSDALSAPVPIGATWAAIPELITPAPQPGSLRSDWLYIAQGSLGYRWIKPKVPKTPVKSFVSEHDDAYRYLNVGATMGNLLPSDLAPLLVAGARVIRREGRLYVTLAVPADPWSAPERDGSEQARRLADEGFRVEWTDAIPVAS